ncbi:MAG: DNA polymerase I [Clostridia bacterium]|nr:DNA polymerase I [Clostridia bacterium]
MEKIVIIDGNSLINRAYFAMQRPMITKEGIYTQGIFGFLNMLSKVMTDYEPEYVAVAFDRKAPTFRHLAYDQYKAGRKKMPPELAMEMPILKDILHAMNIATLEMDGYEADDIIGTVARVSEEGGLEPYIITGDKDALQLATDVTKIIITKRGITDFDIYDKAAMLDRYSLTPTQFIDLKGLMGDTSDNIPGIPGVGEKTGIKLLELFGSVENLVANYSEITNEKLRTKVEENLQLAMLSKKLATINVNTPIEFTLEELKKKPDNVEKLAQIYEKLEFNSFLKKLDLKKEVKEIEFNFTDDLSIFKGKEVYVKAFTDNNHRGKPSLSAVALAFDNNIIYVYEDFGRLKELELRYIGHDLKEFYYSMMFYGVESFNTSFDTKIALYLLNPTKSSYDFFEEEQISLFYEDYLKRYFNALYALKDELEAKIEKENLKEVMGKCELPLIEVLASMEKEGITVDLDILDSLGTYFKQEISSLEEKIYSLADEQFNINSPKQLGDILFGKLNLPAGKKTKTGYSTSAEILDKLKDDYEIVKYILNYRTVSKLNSTYVEGLKPLLVGDKVHAHFQQTVTATGRISCTEPNLQNIPVREELGRELRKAYIASGDKVLIGADYSQIELRVLAHLSQDHELMDAFLNGEDIHRTTASKVLGIPFDQITPEQRRSAKAVNFGVIYGMSSFGLSSELSITRKEAEKYINDYFTKYEGVKQFMDLQKENAKELGYTLTALGRKRYVNEIKSSNFMVRQLGERLAMNSPIQGTAADIIKIAMIKVYERLKKEDIDAKLILQVHDELILESSRKDCDKAKEILVEEMMNAFDLLVPLLCEPNVGHSWYELK